MQAHPGHHAYTGAPVQGTGRVRQGRANISLGGCDPFYLQVIVQNLATWPNLAIRDAGRSYAQQIYGSEKGGRCAGSAKTKTKQTNKTLSLYLFI